MSQNRSFPFTVALLLATACSDKAPANAGTSSASSAATSPPVANSVTTSDSLRGIIGVRGRDSVPDLVLHTSSDTIVLRGTGIEALHRVIGFDVVVRGARTGAIFDVGSFVLRALDGQRVTDGVLDVESGVFFVRTEDGGRVNIGTIPGPLRGEIGSRVYLVGSLDRFPTAFGVIAAER